MPTTKTSTSSWAKKTKAVKDKGKKELASKLKSSKAKCRQVLKTEVEPEKGQGGYFDTAAATLSWHSRSVQFTSTKYAAPSLESDSEDHGMLFAHQRHLLLHLADLELYQLDVHAKSVWMTTKEPNKVDSESEENDEHEGEDDNDLVDRVDDWNDTAELFDEEVAILLSW